MRRASTVLPLIPPFVLLSLGLVPSSVKVVAPAEAQSCAAPAFWDPFDRRCEVYMCAAGWTLGNDNVCRKSGAFPTNAVGGNCKSPIRGNRKLHSLRFAVPAPSVDAVGFANGRGAADGCTDGRSGCS